MGLLDEIMPDVVDSVLSLLDTPAVCIRQPVTSYNAATDTEVSGTPVNFDIFISPPESYSIRDVDGTNVLLDDTKCIASATLAPSSGYNKKTDRITFNSVSFEIVKVAPIYSGSLVCAYELQLRK